MSEGLDAIKFYGGATVGMRTMLDALEPGVLALKSGCKYCHVFFLRCMLFIQFIFFMICFYIVLYVILFCLLFNT